jgi:hypothetical protein
VTKIGSSAGLSTFRAQTDGRHHVLNGGFDVEPPPTVENAVNSVARHFGRVFEHQVLWLEPDQLQIKIQPRQ